MVESEDLPAKEAQEPEKKSQDDQSTGFEDSFVLNSSRDSGNPDHEEEFIPIAIDERPVPVKNPDVRATSHSTMSKSDNVKPHEPKLSTPERIVVPRPGKCACVAKNRSRVLNTGLPPSDTQDNLSIVFIGVVPTDKPSNHRIGFEIRD